MGKWSAGGKYAWNPKRNGITLDTSGFEQMLTRLYSVEHQNSKAVVEEIITEVAEKINNDTKEALVPSNLPAGGKYSKGATERSIAFGAKPTWSSEGVCSIPVGFDFAKKGAGGYLITGTPRMKPDAQLNKMYKQKKYMRELTREFGDKIFEHILAKELELGIKRG